MGSVSRYIAKKTIEYVGSLLDDSRNLAERICALARKETIYLWVTPSSMLYVTRDEQESPSQGEQIGTYVAMSSLDDVVDDLLFMRMERTSAIILPHEEGRRRHTRLKKSARLDFS